MLRLLTLALCAAAVAGTKYKDDEAITLYANKVGPFANPSETYHYYNLPFCQPEGDMEHRTHGLGELLAGDRNVKTPYKVEFKSTCVGCSPWLCVCVGRVGVHCIDDRVRCVGLLPVAPSSHVFLAARTQPPFIAKAQRLTPLALFITRSCFHYIPSTSSPICAFQSPARLFLRGFS